MLKYQIKPAYERDSVRYLQELLCLQGLNVTLDGDFGSVTAHAVQTWRERAGKASQGNPEDVYRDDVDLMLKLTGLDVCTNPTVALPQSFGAAAAYLAQFHAKYRPREVGPDNHGPWVRLYMNGQEGLPWCAGFVSTIYKQVAKLTGLKLPVPGSWSCTSLANQAMGANCFGQGENLRDREIPVGSLFLRRKKRKDGSFFDDAWEHTGIVIEDNRAKNLIKTLEGNTNDNGSREGYEVCEHLLRRDNRDYVLAPV